MLNFFKPAAGRSGFFAAPKPLPPETKAAQPLIALQLSSGAHWTPRNFSALCREGFARNPIVYRCVRLIAEAAASVPLKVEGNDAASEFLTRSPLMSSSTETLEAFYGYLQLSGEAYLEARMRDGVPSFLSALNPDGVAPLQTQAGAVAAWDIDTAEGNRRRLRLDPASGRSPLLSMCLLVRRTQSRPCKQRRRPWISIMRAVDGRRLCWKIPPARVGRLSIKGRAARTISPKISLSD